jgi:BioD-like phosphotransacetylase family protein
MASWVYVGSVRGYAGKNLVSLGIGSKMKEDGLKLGFMKPYGINPVKVGDSYTDADAWMINQTLGLGQTPEDCCPVVRNQDLLTMALRHQLGDMMDEVLTRVEKMQEGKDVLLLSGAGTLRSGAMVGLNSYNLINELGAKAIIVDRYENDFFLDDLMSAAHRLGDNLAGVVINGVDSEMNAVLQEQVVPFLTEAGVKTLGLLPNDELLSSMVVQDVVDNLGAKVVLGFSHMKRLVKKFYVGAMQVNNASKFFGSAQDFGCIVGGDRPDMQLAGIEGGAACLILTGNFYPSDLIMSKAEERQVPILTTRDDTFTVAQKLEFGSARSRLHEEEKIQRGIELVKEGVDFEALYKALELKVK